MKMHSLLIATKNQGKFGEIKEVLEGLEVKLFSLKDLNIEDDVAETERTHEGNAILKARYYFDTSGMPTLAEDSGIHVDQFPEELGVFTRRFRGLENAPDEEWIKVFLEEMKKIPAEKRTARFICVAALIIDTDGRSKPLIFKGETRGVITERLEAPLNKGIPISSCFQPEGCDKVYAALSVEEKNRLSHRGKAMHAVKDFLVGRSL